ncbi:hypothetical protein CPB86DRAFT_715759 [Serendipita vermifera]|nr:hypothetical protein CPB86DRAFT_715759 [Serendipita vermifera]
MARNVDGQQPRKPQPRYPPPKSAVGRFFWRKKMWVEATFALSMLERWEKILVVTLFVSVWALFIAGATVYLPQHLKFLTRRTRYYLLGNERESFHVEWPTRAEL